ncbi:hypothetical protein AVEN_195128-1 [Araneus ventricosus]|uniref:Reverse transcriptase domain-containing protein n=1 Tax=Araneus ventricosus TaxID=182803 RepID=A0A4Y2BG47_ARAVE|nr:hypothetical protein AVEN_195128-1 [Araneus ventricosus]
MTRTTSELAPLFKLPHHTNGGTFDIDGFNVHQARLHCGSSVESGFEPGTLRPQSRDLLTRPPNFIYYYLLDRKVVFKDETLEIERDCHKSCPQGSVLGANFWNIYVNKVLELNSEKVFLQAFADELAQVTTGSVRKELEINTNEALEFIHLTLVELKLELSVGKCQGFAFRSLVHHQKRKGLNISNRKPIFKINGQSIRIGESLKYLGVLLDSRLTWSSHILSLHAISIA